VLLELVSWSRGVAIVRPEPVLFLLIFNFTNEWASRTIVSLEPVKHGRGAANFSGDQHPGGYSLRRPFCSGSSCLISMRLDVK
jgi:hypothetical protein